MSAHANYKIVYENMMSHAAKKFEKLKNTYGRVVYPEQDGVLGFLFRPNPIF